MTAQSSCTGLASKSGTSEIWHLRCICDHLCKTLRCSICTSCSGRSSLGHLPCTCHTRRSGIASLKGRSRTSCTCHRNTSQKASCSSCTQCLADRVKIGLSTFYSNLQKRHLTNLTSNRFISCAFLTSFSMSYLASLWQNLQVKNSEQVSHLSSHPLL